MIVRFGIVNDKRVVVIFGKELEIDALKYKLYLSIDGFSSKPFIFKRPVFYKESEESVLRQDAEEMKLQVTSRFSPEPSYHGFSTWKELGEFLLDCLDIN